MLIHRCENLTLNLPVGPSLRSETVYVNASCSTSSGNASLICPDWNVVSGVVPKDYIMHNITVVKNNTCTRYTSIQVWNPTHWRRKVNQFNLTFKYPLGVPVKQITFERSENREHCESDEDCLMDDQECDPLTKTCRCPHRQVFVGRAKKCFMSASTLFGSCTYSEQCWELESRCEFTKCKCLDNHVADVVQNRCLKVVPSVCENFTVSHTVGPSLPSETVFINASCSTSSGNLPLVCPNWKFVLSDYRDNNLQNHTVAYNNTCVRYTSLQFGKPSNWREKVFEIRVKFTHPSGVPDKHLTIERSENGERCEISEDCLIQGQECCPLMKTCRCPRKQVIVEKRNKCDLAVPTLFGTCSYSEQCREMGAICERDNCKCPANHVADFVHNRCLYKDGSLGGGCDTSADCRPSFTRCDRARCVCDHGYEAVNDVCNIKAGESAASPSTSASIAMCLLTFVVLF